MGRNSDNGIPLMVNWVSRKHCRVVPTGEGTALVEDLRSTLGTWVNGERIDESVMHVGDRLVAGEDAPNSATGFEFELIEV